jgi:hypothetical protein
LLARDHSSAGHAAAHHPLVVAWPLSWALASLGPHSRKLQDECGYPLSEFAVLYPMRTYHGATDIDLPLSIQAALDSAGVLWRWASQDSRSKTDYDIAADSVTISTVHSVKGLDFGCVLNENALHFALPRKTSLP